MTTRRIVAARRKRAKNTSKKAAGYGAAAGAGIGTIFGGPAGGVLYGALGGAQWAALGYAGSRARSKVTGYKGSQPSASHGGRKKPLSAKQRNQRKQAARKPRRRR